MRRVWLFPLVAIAAAVIGCDPPQPTTSEAPPPMQDSQIDKSKVDKPISPGGLGPPKRGGGPGGPPK